MFKSGEGIKFKKYCFTVLEPIIYPLCKEQRGGKKEYKKCVFYLNKSGKIPREVTDLTLRDPPLCLS